MVVLLVFRRVSFSRTIAFRQRGLLLLQLMVQRDIGVVALSEGGNREFQEEVVAQLRIRVSVGNSASQRCRVAERFARGRDGGCCLRARILFRRHRLDGPKRRTAARVLERPRLPGQSVPCC